LNGGYALRKLAVVVIFGFLPLLAIAQKTNPPIPPEVAQEVREHRLDNEDLIIRELADFLSIPNIVTDTPNIQKNPAQVSKMLQARGIETYLLPSKGRSPVAFGSRPVYRIEWQTSSAHSTSFGLCIEDSPCLLSQD